MSRGKPPLGKPTAKRQRQPAHATAGICHHHRSPLAQVTAGIDHPANLRSIRATASGKMPGEKTNTPLAFAFELPPQKCSGSAWGKDKDPQAFPLAFCVVALAPSPPSPPSPPSQPQHPQQCIQIRGGGIGGLWGCGFAALLSATLRSLASVKDIKTYGVGLGKTPSPTFEKKKKEKPPSLPLSVHALSRLTLRSCPEKQRPGQLLRYSFVNA